MKLTLKEFVEKLKNYKNEITDMPAAEGYDPSKCGVCKKAFKPGDREIVADISGTQFHRACFDKAVNNTELQQRRTDSQLPYEDKKEKKTKKS